MRAPLVAVLVTRVEPLNLHLRTPLVSDPQPFKIPIFYQSNPESESNPSLRKQPFLFGPVVFAGYQEGGGHLFCFHVFVRYRFMTASVTSHNIGREPRVASANLQGTP